MPSRNDDPCEHLFVVLGEYAYKLGARDIVKQSGCWERQVTSEWWIACNPHLEKTKCSRGATVPPVTWYVEFNGWPAGLVDPGGWSLAAGSVANEEALRAALKESMTKETIDG